jgi:hypothetical protein
MEHFHQRMGEIVLMELLDGLTHCVVPATGGEFGDAHGYMVKVRCRKFYKNSLRASESAHP